MRRLPTTAEAALLLALNARRKEKETGKPINRLRLAEKAFRKITGRQHHHPGFLADLNESLADYNWTLIVTAEAVGMLKASAIKGWPRLNSQRVDEELKAAREGKFDFDNLNEELVAAPAEEPKDDEDTKDDAEPKEEEA